MPGFYQNRRNYKMRANYPPAPSRNPYSTYSDLQRKMQDFNELHSSPITAESVTLKKEYTNRPSMWPGIPEPEPEIKPQPVPIPKPEPKPQPVPPPKPEPIPQPVLISDSVVRSQPVKNLDPNPVVINSNFKSDRPISLDTYCSKESVDLPGYCNDMTRLIRSLPEEVRTVLTEVQKEFDQIDYKGSFIYDQNPDVTSLRKMAYIIMIRLFPDSTGLSDFSQSTDGLVPVGSLPSAASPVWLYNIIVVLITMELYNRRLKQHNLKN